jgi:hypothetical protein
MARSSCLICHEDYGTEAYLYAAVNSDDNKRVCVECLTTMMTRVIKDKDPFPVRVQHPGDLRPLDYQFLDPAMVEKYKQKEMEHRTYPNERVHVMGCTRCRNTSEVIRVSGRSGRGNWLSSTLVKLRYDQ